MNQHTFLRSVFLALASAFVLSACALGPSAPAEPSVAPKVSLVARAAVAMPVIHPLPVLPEVPQLLGRNGQNGPVQGRSDIVTDTHRYSCVPFARMWSGIQIHGNGGTWWARAKGKYPRSHTPEPGAVMVFAITRRLRYGHVAVVRRVISDREVRVDHSNWGNHGRIYLNARVIDVSAKNDWSRVRVWNTRLGIMGSRVYRVRGFVLPKPVLAKTASAGMRGLARE